MSGTELMPTASRVQGVNGPVGYGAVAGEDGGGHIKIYQVAPPALWGIEFHYRFD
jgi:hypothetical protein